MNKKMLVHYLNKPDKKEIYEISSSNERNESLLFA